MRSIWASISAPLAKENKKFVYADLPKGAESKDDKIALSRKPAVWFSMMDFRQQDWLVNMPLYEVE